MVAPRVGAWIETFAKATKAGTIALSHPVWVRGLKHPYPWDLYRLLGRTPCGCVD